MEADDRQVTTVFTVQPSFHIGTRQTEYHEALLSSANVQSHLTSSFADDGNDGWTVKTVVTRRSSASMIPAPGDCWSI